MTVDYEWRLRLLMAEHGMFKASDLAAAAGRARDRALGIAGLAAGHRTPGATESQGAGRAVRDPRLRARRAGAPDRRRPRRRSRSPRVAARSARTCGPRRVQLKRPANEGVSGRHPIVVCGRCGRTGPGRLGHLDLAGSVPQLPGLRAQAQDALPSSAAWSRSSASRPATTVTSATTASRASTSACAASAGASAGSRVRATDDVARGRRLLLSAAGRDLQPVRRASSRAITPAIRSGRSAWAAPVGARRS